MQAIEHLVQAVPVVGDKSIRAALHDVVVGKYIVEAHERRTQSSTGLANIVEECRIVRLAPLRQADLKARLGSVIAEHVELVVHQLTRLQSLVSQVAQEYAGLSRVLRVDLKSCALKPLRLQTVARVRARNGVPEDG